MVLNDDRFAWLLGTGAPPSEVPGGADLEAAASFATECWQLLPEILPRLLAWGGRASQQSADTQRLRDLATSIRMLSAVQYELCRRYTDELDKQRIPYVLLKGMAARLALYSEPTSRGSLDIDLGVPAAYLSEAERIATTQGFLPASLDPDRRHFHRVDPVERQRVEAEHYELACLVRQQTIDGLPPETAEAIRRSIPVLRPWHESPDGSLGCYVTVDVHHGLCLDITVDDVVSSARRSSGDSYSPLIPSPTWALFHLIFKIYWEGVHNYRKGGYQYADVVRLTSSILTDRDARQLVELLHAYGLRAAGYFVLRRLVSEFGLQLQPSLLEFLEENSHPPKDAFPLDENDLGDMWPKLWGYR